MARLFGGTTITTCTLWFKNFTKTATVDMFQYVYLSTNVSMRKKGTHEDTKADEVGWVFPPYCGATYQGDVCHKKHHAANITPVLQPKHPNPTHYP